MEINRSKRDSQVQRKKLNKKYKYNRVSSKKNNYSTRLPVNCLSCICRYQIIADHINSLEILDNHLNKRFFKHPQDILYSQEYQYYSKEDILKIGYICGQMSVANHFKRF